MCLAEIESLRSQQAALLAHADDEDLKKKVEILQKQIEVLENLVKLLADQVKKAPPAGAAVEQLAEPDGHSGSTIRAGGSPRCGTGRRRR